MKTIVHYLLTTLLLGALVMVALPGDVQAQDPLKMTLVDVSKKGGKRVTKTIRGLMKKSDDISLQSSSDFMAAADKVGLSEKSLRSSKQRRKKAKKIKKALREAELEAVLLVDVYKRGRKAQLVFIGPNGEQVASVVRKIKRGRIKKRVAVAMLKKGFDPLIPVIQDWRENSDGEDEEDDEDEEGDEDEVAEGDGDGDGDGDGKGDGIGTGDKVETEANDGLVARGFTIGAGALFGRRALSVETQSNFNLEHVSPFVGIMLDVGWIFTTFSSGTAGLGINLRAGYAPFTTIFSDPATGNPLELPSTYLRTGGDLTFVKALSETFSVDAYLGGELLAITVEPNSYYTGNQYINMRAGAALGVKFGERAGMRIGGGILPVLSADTSAGAYGDGAFAVGFEGLARVSIGLSDALALQMYYDFALIPPSYPEPVLLSDEVTSSDVMHVGGLTLGLRI